MLLKYLVGVVSKRRGLKNGHGIGLRGGVMIKESTHFIWSSFLIQCTSPVCYQYMFDSFHCKGYQLKVCMIS